VQPPRAHIFDARIDLDRQEGDLVDGGTEGKLTRTVISA